VPTFSKDEINHTLMGRFGNTMLVNGTTNFSLNAHQGDVVRFSVVNTASTRVFRLTIPGTKMKLVGSDNGWYEKETFTDAVTLSPSERAIVDVQFSKSGNYSIKNETPKATYVLGSVQVDGQKSTLDVSKEFNVLKTHMLDDDARKMATEFQHKTPDKELDLTIDMPGMKGMRMDHMTDESSKDGIEWEDTMGMMNSNSTNKSLTWVLLDKATGAKNHDINYSFKAGDKVKIRIFNDPHSMHPMQHTIHFHGNRFLVLATNGKENTNLVWKDSVLVPTGATVDILLEATNLGVWMAHCHISEHLEASMMINYSVQ
jgi:FtsP/CotA-like multicopper oxidase with cupredoxin domain